MSTLRQKLPEYLQKHGRDPYKAFICINPSHEDKSPSSHVKGNTFFKCFSCMAHGDIFTAAHYLEGKPLENDEFIKENVLYLAKLFDIDTSHIKKDDNKESSGLALKYNYIRAYRLVADYLQEFTDKTPTEAFEKEIRRRKWKNKESVKLGVVAGCNFSEVRTALKGNGFNDEFIKLVGLCRPDIFNTDSIIFTIFDEHNNPIAFYSRDTKYEEKKIDYEKTDWTQEIIKPRAPIKYNSSANYVGIYEKRLFPYGIHDIKNFHKVIAVEGHGCRHNLKLCGYSNVIALGGLELSKETLDKLSSFGVTNIVLFLDNDINGFNKAKEIIRTYYGKSNIEFSIMDMDEYSTIKDPDELIRKEGQDIIKTLNEINCIEWLAIKNISKTEDEYEVAKDIASLIALEKSTITRLRLINNISKILDIPSNVLSEEVDQKISVSQDRKSEFALKVLDEAKELIKHNPNALQAAMNIIETRLVDLSKDNSNTELFSSTELLKSVQNFKQRGEDDERSPVITTGFEEWDRLAPFPLKEAFCLLVSPPNALKSSLLLSILISVLKNDENAMIISYTNDDSRDIYICRIVSMLTGLPINWIERPNIYLDEDRRILRDQAFSQVTEWVISERLIIKDVIQSSDVEYYGDLIKFYRNKYPTRSIFSTLDNLHRLQTNSGIDGEKEKLKYVSSLVKSYTNKYDCVILATVEMTKARMYERHVTAESIAETAALQYDANLILFLWNQINALGEEESDNWHLRQSIDFIRGHGYVECIKKEPIIEVLFVKNKLSSFKGSIFFKAYPDIAKVEYLTTDEARRIIATNNEKRPKEEKKNNYRGNKDK